jgi:aspartyl-tRNA(Asn)/glutamyl-tRNA(Gln) amidotransferase subunit A
MSYLDLTIKEIHEALVAKKVTPLELVKQALERAKANTDNAFEIILEQEALAHASALVEPEIDNLLWGIPYVAKDNFSTKDIPTTGGSNILNGYVPLFDATVINLLKQKNAILIGKTTLDELAMGGTGKSGHKGKTFNPYDKTKQRMIGGSSSGSAAAVSAGIVPFSLGSDTGDSVRKPASYAGLVGVKPTWGRISRYGLFPFAPSLDHVGFFTRSAYDAAIVLASLAQSDPNDATCSQTAPENYMQSIGQSLAGKRIAIIEEIVKSKHRPEVIKAFDALVEQLKNDGAIVTIVKFRRDLLEAIFPIYITISCAEATSNAANLDGIKFGPPTWGATYEDAMRQARTAGFSELIKRRFVIGSYALLRDNQDVLFLRAQKGRRLIVEQLNNIYQDHDLILAPSAPSIAPKFEDKTDQLSDEYLIADNHLVLGNFGGFPGITLPLGMLNDMPFGIHVMGRPFEEGLVLAAAQSIEKHTGLRNIIAPGEVDS